MRGISKVGPDATPARAVSALEGSVTFSAMLFSATERVCVLICASAFYYLYLHAAHFPALPDNWREATAVGFPGRGRPTINPPAFAALSSPCGELYCRPRSTFKDRSFACAFLSPLYTTATTAVTHMGVSRVLYPLSSGALVKHFVSRRQFKLINSVPNRGYLPAAHSFRPKGLCQCLVLA